MLKVINTEEVKLNDEQKKVYRKTIDYWKVLAAFNNVDPMNLLPNSNNREYDSEVCLLLYHLGNYEEGKKNNLKELLTDIHKRMFGEKINNTKLIFLEEKITNFLFHY